MLLDLFDLQDFTNASTYNYAINVTKSDTANSEYLGVSDGKIGMPLTQRR
jgi:hypothetical protein